MKSSALRSAAPRQIDPTLLAGGSGFAPGPQQILVGPIDQGLEGVSLGQGCQADAERGLGLSLCQQVPNFVNSPARVFELGLRDRTDELVPAPSHHGVVGSKLRSKRG